MPTRPEAFGIYDADVDSDPGHPSGEEDATDLADESADSIADMSANDLMDEAEIDSDLEDAFDVGAFDEDDDEYESEVDELLDDEDDEDEDEDVVEVPSQGRRAVADRLRQDVRRPGAEAYGKGYAEGFIQGMKAAGAGDDQVVEAYGRLSPLIGQAVRKVGSWLGEGIKGALGDVSVPDLARQAGGQAGQMVRERLGPRGAVEAGPMGAAGVEGDETTIESPTYVAETGMSEDDFSDEEEYGGLRVEDQFGVTARDGFIRSQSTRSSRDAAHLALENGARALRKMPRTSPAVFIEDKGAKPKLFTDGNMWDEAYGALAPVPCPSCSRARSGGDCAVCNGTGTILIPGSDIPEYKASTSYALRHSNEDRVLAPKGRK